MRTRIWNELTKTKHDVEYLEVYSRKQNILSKLITILILIFSSSGILSWSIWNNIDYTGIACAITAGVSLIKLISPYFIMNEKELKKLDKYYFQLMNFFDRIEQFWYNMEDGEIDEGNINSKFYELVKEENNIHNNYNDLDIFHLKRWNKIADENSREYFRNVFNTY
jgi:hypothetical protein